MPDIVIFSYFIGNQSVINQIEIIKINIRGRLCFSQPVFYHSADRTPETVLKNDCGREKESILIFSNCAKLSKVIQATAIYI